MPLHNYFKFSESKLIFEFSEANLEISVSPIEVHSNYSIFFGIHLFEYTLHVSLFKILNICNRYEMMRLL